jgi:hypothetical protein
LNAAVIAAALIKPAEGIWVILDKYGIPTFMLLLLSGAIYKLFWPVLIRQLDVAERRAEKQEERFDKQAADFIKALGIRDQLLLDSFKELHARLDRDLPRNDAPQQFNRRKTDL